MFDPNLVINNTSSSMDAYTSKSKRSSLDGSSFPFKNIHDVKEKLKRQAQFGPDLDLIAASKIESVDPSTYFYDPTVAIIGKGDGILRDKGKYAPFFTPEAKQNMQLQQIKQEKEDYKNQLEVKLTNPSKDKFINRMVKYANAGIPFENLPFPNIIMPKALNDLRNAYNTLAQGLGSSKQPYKFPDTMGEFLDFGAIPLENEFVKRVKDDIMWTNRSADLENLIQQYWTQELHAQTGSFTIKNLFQEKYDKGITSDEKKKPDSNTVFVLLKNALKIDGYDKVLSSMCAVLFERLDTLIKDKPNQAHGHIEIFENTCASNYFDDLFTLIENADQPSPFEDDCLKTLMKEQKIHSVARFHNLINYYTAFVNTVHDLAKLSGKKEVIQIVDKILENAHHSIDKIDDSLKDIITITPKGHRESFIMGGKAIKLDPNEVDRSMELMNLYHSEPIKGLDRAHTLPFPACFAWKPEKIVSFVNDAFGTGFSKDDLQECGRFLNNKVFEILTKSRVEHDEIETILFKEMEDIQKRSKNDSEFIYRSLILIQGFYLRLFSETELLPEFINKEMDGLSEWKTNTNDTYKKELAFVLRGMINEDRVHTKKDTADALAKYFEKTEEVILGKNNELTTKNSLTTTDLFKLICMCNIRASIERARFCSNLNASTECVFNNTITI